MADSTYPHPLHEDHPAGYVIAGPIMTYGDDELPQGVLGVVVDQQQYPALTRVLNLIRMDTGGPMRPPQQVTNVPEYWLPWLPCMEAAVAALRTDVPAPEDPDGQADYAAGNMHGLSSELHCFAIGEHTASSAIARRSYALTAASNLLSDFFEGWCYGRDLAAADGKFSPAEVLLGEADGMASPEEEQQYLARTDTQNLHPAPAATPE
jgi:hypothetical protein